jgi:hypothetical protein
MLESRRLTTLWASKVCYSDSFSFRPSGSYAYALVISNITFPLLIITRSISIISITVREFPQYLQQARHNAFFRSLSNTLFFLIRNSPLGTSAIYWPIVPAPGDCEDGEFGGIKIGRGSQSTRKKPVAAPLCPPQIPLDQTRVRTRAAAVGSQRLIA